MIVRARTTWRFNTTWQARTTWSSGTIGRPINPRSQPTPKNSHHAKRLTSTVHVDGVISADGGPHDIKAKYGGGGSGGSIWISCEAITGKSGKSSADGGGGSIYAGGGGGGRVAVETDATRQDAKPRAILFSAVGGANGHGLFGTEKPGNFGEPGTLYFSSGSVPGRMFPVAGVVVQSGQTPQTERKSTAAY